MSFFLGALGTFLGCYVLGVIAGFFHKPKQPTAFIGLILGRVRLENGAGGEAYTDGNSLHFVIAVDPQQLFLDEASYAVTHIQYQAPFGFYLAWPMCFYFWLVWKRQRVELNPNAANDPDHKTLRVPGSEQGLIFRLPGWRWQGADGTYIFTKGQAGLHYD